MIRSNENLVKRIKENIKFKNMIFSIRDRQVMVDRDLASLYQVETKVLNQAVKRNIERFPGNFRFQLNNIETKELVTNCDRLSLLKYASTNPYVFTEQGISMLSAVLKSDIAVRVSIQIMNAFIKMRKYYSINSDIFRRLENVEKRQIGVEKKFEKIFKAFEDKSDFPGQGIFYDGQIFDAHVFISDLIRSANHSIKVIDNYIDERVLTLLSKKKKGVKVIIYTNSISRQLELDIEKFNKQYPWMESVIFKRSHDRFMIIDDDNIYHIGASLKDLGKKWFAFSKLHIDPQLILKHIDHD
ncbi:MAG: ORF6N domain-containing protein [Candidatus Marinimicrobia bacterium]|nr:ORF6N domain-containing protein [Candidatus Neomarinimicrobiota bacterium]